ALKLRYAEAAHQLVAVGFDYIPHAKILSQPDAIPDELIAEAIEKFLSRNKLGGDIVAIGLPAQSSLARFIQLPPIEPGKIKEIVKYEAKQQIPFPLDEVIWDYQQMGGGDEHGGFVIDSEVGIFAMKRDQVMHQLQPFQTNKVEVELMQMAPLALYNYLAYDQLSIRPNGEGAPPQDDHIAVLDMGTDQSTIMVTNGQKIWIRNIAIGGNHFTRALTKEMKLTFAKAEHLKCNATKSPDPKAVFQALKPVFNDYLSEVQRSLGYFASISKGGEVKKVIGCGNGFRMAGLQKFLEQNLELPVERADEFRQLAGTSVLEANLFRENILTFTVAYGLAVQAIGMSTTKTNLLPPEIARAREIRRKKPWAAVTAATLLFSLAVSTIGYANAWSKVHTPAWEDSLSKTTQLTGTWGGYKSSYDTAKGRYTSATTAGAKLVEGMKDTIWLEFYKSFNECLPRDIGEDLDEENIEYRNRILIKSMTATWDEDLSTWYSGLTESYRILSDEAAQDHGLKPQPAPEGSGYIFRIVGEHYHHIPDKPETDQGINYLLDRVIPPLQAWTFKQEDGPRVDVRRMGIINPVVTAARQEVVNLQQRAKNTRKNPRINVINPSNRNFNSTSPMPMPLSSEEPSYDGNGGLPNQGTQNMESKEVHRTQFSIEFVWKPIPVADRVEADPLAEAPAETSTDGTTEPTTEEATTE
ncbi:MAG: type IV pilus assembly protein PilM, partial [Planctomycetaceae bacterium]|nr:type IV pilus assembly protein PilM [Planctomycetaceae bacterium]